MMCPRVGLLGHRGTSANGLSPRAAYQVLQFVPQVLTVSRFDHEAGNQTLPLATSFVIAILHIIVCHVCFLLQSLPQSQRYRWFRMREVFDTVDVSSYTYSWTSSLTFMKSYIGQMPAGCWMISAFHSSPIWDETVTRVASCGDLNEF